MLAGTAKDRMEVPFPRRVGALKATALFLFDRHVTRSRLKPMRVSISWNFENSPVRRCYLFEVTLP
jgi:hypothetical protein